MDVRVADEDEDDGIDDDAVPFFRVFFIWCQRVPSLCINLEKKDDANKEWVIKFETVVIIFPLLSNLQASVVLYVSIGIINIK